MSIGRRVACTLFSSSGKSLVAGTISASALLFAIDFLKNAIEADAGSCIDPHWRMVNDAIYFGVLSLSLSASAFPYFLAKDVDANRALEEQSLLAKPSPV
jgi:hypothetical protein